MPDVDLPPTESSSSALGLPGPSGDEQPIPSLADVDHHVIPLIDHSDGHTGEAERFEQQDIDDEIQTYNLEEIRVANDFIKLIKAASIGDAHDNLLTEYAVNLRN